MRAPSEIPPQETRDEIDNMSLDQIKELAFTMLKIKQHLSYFSEVETREREKLRLKIAQKNINCWQAKYRQ